MRKSIKKFLCLAVTSVVTAGMMAGCMEKEKMTSDDIIMWADLTTKEGEEFKKYADTWTKKTGQGVKIINTSIASNEYIKAMGTTKSPDILFGVSTEEIETLKVQKAIEPVTEKIISNDNYISSNLVHAVTYKDKQYGFPIAQSTVGMFYRTDKVLPEEVPTAMEDLMKVGKSKGLRIETDNMLMAYGFLSANGGYLFKEDNGSYDEKDIGVANDGATKGYQAIQDLIQKHEAATKGITDSLSASHFALGKASFYIGNTAKMASFDAEKIPYKATEMVTLGGKEMTQLDMVDMAFVNPKSKRKNLSYDFLKYIIENTNETLIKSGERLPVLKTSLETESYKKNQNMQLFTKQVQNADLVPNIIAAQTIWESANKNLSKLTAGKISAKQCGQNIKNDMIEQMKLIESQN